MLLIHSIRRHFSLKWPAQLVRRTFIEYFENLGCQHVPSSSLIPKNDKTLAFVNAGMNQFKDVFVNTPDQQRSSKFNNLRLAANSQRCLRISGKHCDLDSVGLDGHHHTFFEMLGNWSFHGCWSKKQACLAAWRLLTETFGLPSTNFYVTYFAGDEKENLEADVETKEAWLEIGIPQDRIIPLTSKDNFWEMAATGPCGPCTEILIGSTPETRVDQCLELWNVVFIQYNKTVDGTLQRLPLMHVDTGMGLERLCRILQNVDDNYKTDLFTPLFDRLQLELGRHRSSGSDFAPNELPAARVVVDHARACSALGADGVVPGARHQSQVLRRLIRRAVFRTRFVFNAEAGVLSRLVPVVAETLADGAGAEEHVWKNLSDIATLLENEETKFMKQLDQSTAHLAQQFSTRSHKVLSAEEAFYVYNTFGVPVEVLKDLADRFEFKFDVCAFQQEKKKHVIRSQSSVVK